jgi:regulator of protease activity HflC (stomatin/prohibitin superfamily)
MTRPFRDTYPAPRSNLVHDLRRGRGNGVVVRSVGVKDVILPGEMKVILNQVVEAEKIAQANLIQRREETAATRSMLNTALDGRQPDAVAVEGVGDAGEGA